MLPIWKELDEKKSEDSQNSIWLSEVKYCTLELFVVETKTHARSKKCLFLLCHSTYSLQVLKQT